MCDYPTCPDPTRSGDLPETRLLLTSDLMKYFRVPSLSDRTNRLLRNCPLSRPIFISMPSLVSVGKGGGPLTSTSWSSQRDRLRDFTFPMSGMLRWTPEQSRQMKIPREQDPHSGCRCRACGGSRAAPEVTSRWRTWWSAFSRTRHPLLLLLLLGKAGEEWLLLSGAEERRTRHLVASRLQQHKMEAIYNLLEKFRLQTYYNRFLELGVTDERDFIDSVLDEDVDKMGCAFQNRLDSSGEESLWKLKDHVKRLRAQARPRVPWTRGRQEDGGGIPPSIHIPARGVTWDDFGRLNTSRAAAVWMRCRGLMAEAGSPTASAWLPIRVEGMPLTDDPFLNTWSLKERHIENKDILYAIFTPKQNLEKNLLLRKPADEEASGEQTVRCRIMLKGNFDISVNLTTDTINDLRRKTGD
ncbi:hypothetical protein N1851_018026 [Merluccius polli]|uniref:Uncharacterized protein n=1 Tax=Merluccius polli TaxID=89951 RepID=A0AA47MNS0_MERPO|nr:hypothetical protein N1851_018026 [Merluccius polli]